MTAVFYIQPLDLPVWRAVPSKPVIKDLEPPSTSQRTGSPENFPRRASRRPLAAQTAVPLPGGASISDVRTVSLFSVGSALPRQGETQKQI